MAGSTFISTPLILADPGVKIIIPANATLSTNLYRPVKIEGCESMWRGIQVITGGTLDLNNTTISDAQFAVNANKGSKVIIKNTTFLNNDYGIYTNSTGSGGYDLTLLSNQFMTTASGLKSTYTGQTPVPSIKGYVGVYLNNATAGVNIDSDPGSSSTNLFSNLKFGILSYNSSLNIKNTAFENIETVSKGTGYDAQPPVTGHAVYASGGTLNIQGGIVSANPPVSFTNCLNGITGYGADLSVKECNIDKVENGIVAVSTTGNKITLAWNTVNATNSGIFTAQINNIQPERIENNTVNLIPGAYYHGIGISAYGLTGSGAAQNVLLSNIVTLKNGTTGIHLGNVSNTFVTENIVNLSSQADQYGIRTDAGEKITVNCNDVNGDATPGSSALSRGIYAIHTSQAKFICNTSDKTADGLHFEGVLVGKEKADVAGNTMSNNANGLLLGTDAVIGTQTNRGNKWKSGVGGVTVARHLTPPAALSSLFIVDSNENSEFLPGIAAPQNFFLDLPDSANSFICNQGTTCPLPTTVVDLNIDRKIAKGLLPGISYQAANNWLAQRRLYERILKEGNPVPEDSVFTTFISQAQNTDLALYAAIQGMFHNSFGTSISLSDTLARQINEIFGLLNSLGDLDQLIAGSGDSSQIAELQTQRQVVMARTNILNAAREAIFASIRLNQLATAAALSQQNNGLTPVYIYQQNEQQINRLLLSYITGGYSTLDSVSMNILKGIASQCPLSGGEAVLRARALLNVMNPAASANYNDLSLCVAVEPRQVQPDATNENVWISVYPNPVSMGLLNIAYQLPEVGSEYRLMMFNVLGDLVLNTSLEGNAGQKQLMVQELNNGIYYYIVQTEEKRFAQGKLVVLR